jgi:hypothetical protein
MLYGYSEVRLAVTMLCQLQPCTILEGWLTTSVIPAVRCIDTRLVTVISLLKMQPEHLTTLGDMRY